MAHWEWSEMPCPPVSMVPEPGTLTSLLAGIILLAGAGRRPAGSRRRVS
jgi:hypothetical protein